MIRRVQFVVAASVALATPASAQQQIPTPLIVVDIPTPPTPFIREGRVNLAYEIHITNLSPGNLIVQRVDILEGAGDATLSTIMGDDLAESIIRPVPALKLRDAKMVEPGRRALVLVWAQLASGMKEPKSLRHRITMERMNDGLPGGPAFRSNSVTTAPVALPTTRAPILGAPLKGGRWVARFSGNPDSHRRAVYALHGEPRAAQRYAIDFGLLGEDGRQFKVGGSTNADMYGHNAEVLAVANARVVVASDGMPENDPTQAIPPSPTIAAAMGNHIVLDLGNGLFAAYAHLRTGTIAVKPGDRVMKGQTIARIGNTGSSSGPHLHFQVMSNADFELADGRPYMFDDFMLIGIESLTQFQAVQWTPDSAFRARRVTSEMPTNRGVIRFP